MIKKYLFFIVIIIFLTGCCKSNEKSWKTEYIGVVEKWQSEKGENVVGYEFIYLDDDEIPELVLYCHEGAFVGFDMYTIYNDEATKLELYECDGEKYNDSIVLTSPGRQMQSDRYFLRQGIYIQETGMMDIRGMAGYFLEEGKLKRIFEYTSYFSKEDEYVYRTAYLDDKSGLLVEKSGVVTDESEDEFYSTLDEVYGISFYHLERLSENNDLMDYRETMDFLK